VDATDHLFAREIHRLRKGCVMANNTLFSQLEPEQQKRLLDKVAKLKALSECQTGNVNETATAAARMTRIILEYKIEQADLEELDESEVVERTALADSYNGFPVWQTTILSALAEVNQCQSYSETQREDCLYYKRTRSSLKIIGTAEDIESTLSVFHFCLEEVERLCYYWSPRASVKRKNDFKRGAANGIASKVLAERELVIFEEEKRAAARSKSSVALQLFERKENAVSEYAAGIGLRIVKRRQRAVNRDAYVAGFQAGTQMELGMVSTGALSS
jgi:hypothetical protein